MKVPFLKRLLSYLYPVRIRTAAGKTTPVLGLYLYQNRWQLGAATALYSDGHRYRPLYEAFHYLEQDLAGVRHMLVLGAGLGSAVYVLDRMRLRLPVTLVDLDETVINWARELLPEPLRATTEWVCADARQFVQTQQAPADLLVIDLFQDRVVPAFATSSGFLEDCSRLLDRKRGHLVINYIVNNQDYWETALSHIKQHFRIRHILSMGINKVVIASPLAG